MNYDYDIIFLLEERSMQGMLEVLLPKIIPEEIIFKCIPHEGKSDLEKSIPRKLKAWNTKKTKFVILRDQDSGDCYKTKQGILALCKKANKSDVLVRIVCHEMESWFLGDLNAVERALDIPQLSQKQNNKKYRVI